MITNSMWQITSAVQKQVLKNKGTLKLNVSDIFKTQTFSGTVNYQDIDIKIKRENIICRRKKYFVRHLSSKY
jgi:hypothetical protein